MKKILYLIFFTISLFISCNEDSGLKPDELSQNKIESRSSERTQNSIVPIEIANEIAVKYPIVKPERFIDKNETQVQREVLNHFTLPDKEGVPALYVFTYNNNLGYLVISAEWRHEPICAITSQGTFPDIEAPSMLIEWFDATIENIEYIRYNGFDNSERARMGWEEIDNDLDIVSFVLPDDECCEDCPNWPECDFDFRIGCGGDADLLCRGITKDDPCGNWTYTTVGPLMTTEWGQECTYNNLCIEEKCNGNLLDCPDNCRDNPVTGCVATAMAQVIRYWQIPSAQGYNYASMPNFWGNGEVQRLMYDAGCSVDMTWGCDESGANGDNVPGALINDFDFGSADRDSYGVGDYQTIVNNLDHGQPVLLEGCRVKDTFLGITYRYRRCHEWVCDGYFSSRNYCFSYLQFYMNWGWDGDHNGFFSFNNWHIPDLDRNYQYARDYVHEIHP